ncbi:MAG: hypothetical protein ACSHWU_10250 [Marinicella sp.]
MKKYMMLASITLMVLPSLGWSIETPLHGSYDDTHRQPTYLGCKMTPRLVVSPTVYNDIECIANGGTPLYLVFND